MLRRVSSSSPLATASSSSSSIVASALNGMRFSNGIGPDPIGAVHPDVRFGYHQTGYKGRGWANVYKQMPQDQLVCEGGATPSNQSDRMGWVVDPEDPRHPIVRMQVGESKMFDGAVHTITTGSYGPIRKGSRLLQILYAHYLEPFSCNRVCVHLRHWEKVPNNHHALVEWTVDYVGQTCSFIGGCFIGGGTTVMEGVTMRGDTNQVFCMEGVQVMENCMLMSDAPTTLHHYQRSEALNPYQTWDAVEGVVKICGNVILEPNCMIEACHIGTFTRVGHNCKIMKGAQIGSLCQILPGSVVLADAKIHDGEIWAGAPAKKVGKVSKMDYKRPWYYSCAIREMVNEGYDGWSHYGDQMVLREQEMDKLDMLMITYEHDLPESLQKQICDFVDGREPYNHTIARLTQGWSLMNQKEHMTMDGAVPAINPTPYRDHNEDAYSDYAGTVFNWKHYAAEKRW